MNSEILHLKNWVGKFQKSEIMVREGHFVFGIKIYEDENGIIRVLSRNINTDVPQEVLISRLKVHLRKLENEYFKNYLESDS